MKISLLVAIFVVVCFCAGCIYFDVFSMGLDSNDGGGVKTTEQLNTEFEDYLVKYKQRRLFGNDSTKIDRAAYGVSLRVFEDLPSVPSDFLSVTYLIKSGKMFDLASLGPEYWMQPEFDPEFSRQGLRYWRDWSSNDYNKDHWSTMGIRTYPYSQYVSAVPGDSFNVTLLVSTDWSVETYQGLGLTPFWLESAVYHTGGLINSSLGPGKYINVNITPDNILLMPAFPKFTYGWVQLVTLTGKIDNSTPDGVYILSMDVGNPSDEQSEEWFMEYLNLYSEGIHMIELDKPYLQVFINVDSNGE